MNMECDACSGARGRGREILKELSRYGKRMKDMGYRAKQIAKEIDGGDGVTEAVRVAVRYQSASDAYDALREESVNGRGLYLDRKDTETWARSTESLAEFLRPVRERLARDARAEEVNRVLNELGELQRYGSMFSFTDYLLRRAETRFPPEAVARVDAYVERGAGSLEEVRRACVDLTRVVKQEPLRRRAREVELAHALRAKGLHRRKDSTLCTAFVNGTSSKTAYEVAEVMARFRYLYKGHSPEFNEKLANFVIVDFFSDDDDDEDDAYGRREYVDENGELVMAFPVTQSQFVEERRRLAEAWTRFPAVWPWLEHKVVRIQRWWRKMASDPYTRAGKNRLLREFDLLTSL